LGNGCLGGEGGTKKKMEMELISRERATQKQEEKNRILKEKYNKKYKDINVYGREPKYLWKENLNKLSEGEEMRALLKLRCGNLEVVNKYWLDENHRVCVFCDEGKDNVEHYIRENVGKQ